MILDTIENRGRYTGLHEGFRRAFDFLAGTDLAALPEGRCEIDGDRVFAIVSEGPGRSREGAELETHERHIDIQYVVSGTDEMGWKPAPRCIRPTRPYDPGRDIAFFDDPPDAWVAVPAGAFAIFYPEDAHLPLVSRGIIRKVVVKVAVRS